MADDGVDFLELGNRGQHVGEHAHGAFVFVRGMRKLKWPLTIDKHFDNDWSIAECLGQRDISIENLASGA